MSIEEQLDRGTTIEAVQLAETDKAVKFNCEGDIIWVPKGKFRFNKEKRELTLPDWLFKAKFPNG